jgi:hypothetical protein
VRRLDRIVEADVDRQAGTAPLIEAVVSSRSALQNITLGVVESSVRHTSISPRSTARGTTRSSIASAVARSPSLGTGHGLSS